ncbi:hypothetical protein RND81_14G035300 [Saponaria officinalis]|uniref:Cytoplasmic tRNA 2-thiolation protein 2 n=1 Tax=Saponaria officinalis TaxID=3572 RepID=A0AAW1GN11_SAPOF
MSCGKPSCKSGGCDNYDDDVKNDQQQQTAVNLNRRQTLNPNLCVKCKLSPPLAGASDDSRFCGPCFRANLFGKFRLAVTSHAMISPTDRILVAFSAGTCSRLALQFVHDMHLKAQNNFDASRDKSLPVFSVGVAFIDESFARSIPFDVAAQAILHVKAVVNSLSPPHKDLHVASLENIYSSADVADGRSRLTELLDTFVDSTGKDDFLTHLRMLCLQKVAVENGYNKLVLGSCTSTIARHVLSATVKGQGYSLPADIQYVDARWEIPVLLPLRDCLAQELSTLCQLDGLKTLSIVNGPQSGINSLVSSFVSLLQEENPSRECTIVRTAGKLTPFSFNKLPVVDDPKAYLASQRRQKKFNMTSNESSRAESFCSICYSPLHESDSYSLGSSAGEEPNAAGFGATCCSSCRFQILPADSSHMERFYSLLPQPLISRQTTSSSCVQRLLRESIEDFLISDSEDGYGLEADKLPSELPCA